MNAPDLLELSQKRRNDAFYKLFQDLVECSQVLKDISPNKRKLWLIDVIDNIFKTQKGLCAICREKVNRKDCEVDHVIPFCYGGGNERGNLQLACRSCNRKKSSAVKPHDLLEYLEDRAMNI